MAQDIFPLPFVFVRRLGHVGGYYRRSGASIPKYTALAPKAPKRLMAPSSDCQKLHFFRGDFIMSQKDIRRIGFALAATVFCIAAGSAMAQATRTWVSGVGDDVNPCSRTAPCKTFAGAISKTAPGGEIDALDPGGYGAVTITKAITIDGGAGQVAGVLVSGTNGIVIQAGATDVVRLRNLDINGVGTGLNGIRFLNGAGLEVHNVQIYGFTQQGISFEPPAGVSSLLKVSDSSIENNTLGGVLLTGAGSTIASLARVSLARNQRAVRAEDGSIVHIKDSIAVNNWQNGFVAVGTSRPVTMTLDGCVSAGNAAAGVFSGSLATVILTHSTVSGNATGLMLSGGAIVSSGNNTVQGNGVNGSPSSTPGSV